MLELSILGKRLPRLDGDVKAAGSAQYSADIILPRMLYGKILRSPYPHARILNIDTGRARGLAGVKCVITGKDTLGEKYGRLPHIPHTVDEHALAIDKVRYIGDDVAAVAAVDEDTAEEALELIRVDYQELPPVFDPLAAMAPAAPKIHQADRNIAWEIDCNFGDLKRAFKQADCVREDEFITRPVIHCALETHASLASCDASGKLTLWSSTQTPFYFRRDLAKLLGMAEADVRVIRPYVGGGFGGKRDLCASDFCAALLSRLTMCPVKVVYTRDEEFVATRRRHGMIIKLKTGVKSDGTILGQECECIADGGAYNSTGPVIIGRVGVHLVMQYKVPNFRCRAYLVYTNNPVCGAFRGFGHTQACFANESHLDRLAEELSMDPIDLRVKNAMEAGYKHPLDFRMNTCGLKECLKLAAESPLWRQRSSATGKSSRKRGLGAAVCSYISGFMGLPSAAFVELGTDGSVKLIAGGAEIGQGSDTVLCQIAAEELGIDLDRIRICSSDTDVTPIDLGSFSSRTTLYTGNAVQAACRDAKSQLLDAVAQKLEAKLEDLECRDNWISVKGSPNTGMSFADGVKASIYSDKGMPILGRGFFNPPVRVFDLASLYGNATPAYTFGIQLAEVEVDTDTGQVKVLRVFAAHDCGRVLNPICLEGQVEGSIMMGLGQGLCEDVLLCTGQVLNPGFSSYLLPTVGETPDIQSSFVETIEPNGPFGAKGVSEGTQLPMAPAIANAVYNALGVRIKELPITPDKVLKALEAKQRTKS